MFIERVGRHRNNGLIRNAGFRFAFAYHACGLEAVENRYLTIHENQIESLVFQYLISLLAIVRNFNVTAEFLEHSLCDLLIDQVVFNHQYVAFGLVTCLIDGIGGYEHVPIIRTGDQ